MPPDYTGLSATTIWIQWTDGTTGTTVSNMTSQTWGYWTAAATNTTGVYVQQPPPPLTEEQRVERARVAAEANRKREEVRARARELLMAVLDRKQQRDLEARGYFHVQTRNGERVYRFRPGSAPVRIKGEDGSQWSYCIHPDYGFPPDDVTAGLKLLLDADEAEFLRIANASRARVPA